MQTIAIPSNEQVHCDWCGREFNTEPAFVNPQPGWDELVCRLCLQEGPSIPGFYATIKIDLPTAAILLHNGERLLVAPRGDLVGAFKIYQPYTSFSAGPVPGKEVVLYGYGHVVLRQELA